jgi:multimeric flavodoxin WrbA
MASQVSRRSFLGAAGAAAVSGAAAGAGAAEAGAKGSGLKVVAVACSPRAGKTTAQGLKVCLEAAREAAPGIETELVELAGRDIPVFDPASPGSEDFKKVAAVLADPKVRGVIVGTPVYFGDMSSLAKAFLDQCIALRKDGFALSGKVAGVLAVGGARNGGQELTIQSVQAVLMCHEMVIVGDGRPSAHRGATLWNQGDDISGDEFGVKTAQNLGRRVAEVAVQMTNDQ